MSRNACVMFVKRDSKTPFTTPCWFCLNDCEIVFLISFILLGISRLSLSLSEQKSRLSWHSAQSFVKKITDIYICRGCKQAWYCFIRWQISSFAVALQSIEQNWKYNKKRIPDFSLKRISRSGVQINVQPCLYVHNCFMAEIRSLLAKIWSVLKVLFAENLMLESFPLGAMKHFVAQFWIFWDKNVFFMHDPFSTLSLQENVVLSKLIFQISNKRRSHVISWFFSLIFSIVQCQYIKYIIYVHLEKEEHQGSRWENTL